MSSLGRRDEAIQAYRRALEINPSFAHAHSNLGGVLANQGRLDEAIEHFQRAVEAQPGFVMGRANLGIALVERGRLVEARNEFLKWLELTAEDDPMHAAARSQLSRCEQLLAFDLRLPAVLGGQEVPADAAENAQFAELCRVKQHYASATRFWKRAFELDPKLTADPRTTTRIKAACCAAMAGSARDVGGDTLSDLERASYRSIALDWLHAELELLTRLLRASSDAPRDFARSSLANWREDPDLTDVRDVAGLASMSREEADRCRAFWREVDLLLSGSGR